MSLFVIAMALRGASTRLPDMFIEVAINKNVRHSGASMEHKRRVIVDALDGNKPSGGSGQ